MTSYETKPIFHLYLPQGWVNDPNGPLYFAPKGAPDKGKYHMFYQSVTDSTKWTWGLAWGHASSADLIHWKHLPAALVPTPGGWDADGCFSGCATVDPADGRPAILYTGVVRKPDAADREGMPLTCSTLSYEAQCLAKAVDPEDPDLVVWEKDAAPWVAAPPPGMRVNCFRDPFVLETPSEANGGVWRVMVGSCLELKQGDACSAEHKTCNCQTVGTAVVYRSKSLHEGWEYDGLLCVAGPGEGGIWECPVMARLAPDPPAGALAATPPPPPPAGGAAASSGPGPVPPGLGSHHTSSHVPAAAAAAPAPAPAAGMPLTQPTPAAAAARGPQLELPGGPAVQLIPVATITNTAVAASGLLSITPTTSMAADPSAATAATPCTAAAADPSAALAVTAALPDVVPPPDLAPLALAPSQQQHHPTHTHPQEPMAPHHHQQEEGMFQSPLDHMATHIDPHMGPHVAHHHHYHDHRPHYHEEGMFQSPLDPHQVPAPTHMFSVSAGVCPAIYWLGRYQGGRFDLVNAEGPYALDMGDVVYAPNLMVDKEGRQLIWAWLQEHPNPGGAHDYAGCISLPRVLALQGGRLVQSPLPELEQLRTGRGLRLRGIPLPHGKAWSLPDHICASHLDLTLKLTSQGAKRVTLVLGPLQQHHQVSLDDDTLLQQLDTSPTSHHHQQQGQQHRSSQQHKGPLCSEWLETVQAAAITYEFDSCQLQVLVGAPADVEDALKQQNKPFAKAAGQPGGMAAPASVRLATSLCEGCPVLGNTAPMEVPATPAPPGSAPPSPVRTLCCQLRGEPHEEVTLRLLLDYSILELFAGTGEVLTTRVYRGAPTARAAARAAKKGAAQAAADAHAHQLGATMEGSLGEVGGLLQSSSLMHISTSFSFHALGDASDELTSPQYRTGWISPGSGATTPEGMLSPGLRRAQSARSPRLRWGSPRLPGGLGSPRLPFGGSQHHQQQLGGSRGGLHDAAAPELGSFSPVGSGMAAAAGAAAAAAGGDSLTTLAEQVTLDELEQQTAAAAGGGGGGSASGGSGLAAAARQLLLLDDTCDSGRSSTAAASGSSGAAVVRGQDRAARPWPGATTADGRRKGAAGGQGKGPEGVTAGTGRQGAAGKAAASSTAAAAAAAGVKGAVVAWAEVSLMAVGGDARVTRLEAYEMGTMWT